MHFIIAGKTFEFPDHINISSNISWSCKDRFLISDWSNANRTIGHYVVGKYI